MDNPYQSDLGAMNEANKQEPVTLYYALFICILCAVLNGVFMLANLMIAISMISRQAHP